MASKVYFADLRADYHENLQQKLTRLMKTAGMGNIDFQDKYVAIKLHFGEPGNLAFLRPNWAKTVADFVKERGGKPFLTDCNTLYVGGRKNALDHMDSAMLNGFGPMTTGCQIIIADGLKGNDEVEVPVVGGEYVKNAKIGRAVMDADVFISLTHFKGHEEAGFGGCLKNIGMGCGSRRGSSRCRDHRRGGSGDSPLHFYGKFLGGQLQLGQGASLEAGQQVVQFLIGHGISFPLKPGRRGYPGGRRISSYARPDRP